MIKDLSEAKQLLDALAKIQEEDPSFNFVIDLNEWGQLSRLFWMDQEQSKLAYFMGTVLLADTTFKFEIGFVYILLK